MPRAFISYSRKDVGFAQQLFDTLTQGGRDCWIDLKGIPPTAEWLEEIRDAIDGAEAFVFVISPDSCSSDICQAEVAHAVERHKRLILLHYRDTPRDAIPAAIAKLNWIFFRTRQPSAPTWRPSGRRSTPISNGQPITRDSWYALWTGIGKNATQATRCGDVTCNISSNGSPRP